MNLHLRRFCVRNFSASILATSVATVLLVCGAATRAAGQRNVAARQDYAEVAARLSAFIEHELSDKQLPALSVALVDDQQVIWAQGFGFADPDQKRPATAETVYRVGSVSKLFTDIGIMRMVERGELNLDAPITSIITDFHPQNPFGKPITLRELISHRSGLLREPPRGNYFDPTPPPLADVVHSLNDTGLVYPPGAHTKYSNAGITVVGYVLQQKAGKPFVQALKQAVLEPMGLNSSGFAPEPALMKNLAKAHMWTYDGRVFEAPKFELGIFPAGCMYTTVEDLGRFLSVLFARGHGAGGQVLKPETLEQMWMPQFAQAGQKTGFGLGFLVTDLDGHRMVEHDGAIYGFATTLKALPDDKIGAVAVTTKDSANAVTDRVAEEALRLMLAARAGKSLPEIPEPTPLPPEMARRLAGRYAHGEGFIDLTERNGHLFMLQGRGGNEVELHLLDGKLIVDDKLEFGTLIEPRADSIQLGSSTYDRVKIPKPNPVQESWKGLIGEYGWDHDILYILEKEGRLTALIEWFEYDPLAEVWPDVFAFPSPGLYEGEKAAFVRGANGQATEVRVGGVVFKRRAIGPAGGGIFRIQPLKKVDVLRRKALAAKPPVETGDFLKPDLVELTKLDPSIKLDIRYATTNDFISTPVYTEARAFMERPAAEALVRAHQKLRELGYGLLIHDAYRPWYVTKMFWDATPDDKKIFVANPQEGSRHNRGCAVDLTLYELKSGKPVETVGVYDEMSERSYPDYPGGTSLQRWYRALLRHAMEEQGFTVYEFEWWHFDYKEWRKYPILNLTFDQILPAERTSMRP